MFKNYGQRTYDIEKFYVGELYLEYPIEVLFNYKKITEEEVRREIKKNEAINNGAIEIENNMIVRKKSYNIGKNYDLILTIFYKDKDEYLCIHNGEIYKLDGVDFCDNLVPFKNYLPKYSFDISNKFPLEEVLYLFNLLFTKKTRNKLAYVYNENDKYNMDDFFVGDINLYCGFTRSRIKIYSNLPEKYLLLRNGAKLKEKIKKEETDIVIKTHNYEIYKSLFMKTSEGMYNINNFQIYKPNDFENINQNFLGESYLDGIIPLKEVISINESKIKKLSIPQAIRINKK